MSILNTFVTVFLLFLVSISAQSQVLGEQTRRMPLTTDLFSGMPIVRPKTGIVGNIYFNEAWSFTSITLYEVEKPITGVRARYNIYFEELDINTPNGEKALEDSKVKSFTMDDSVRHFFVNASAYTIDGVPLKGFLEVLVDGKTKLLKRYHIILKNPDYNPALSAGSRDVKVVHMDDSYYTSGSELTRIQNKKKLLAGMGDKGKLVEEFMKKNYLSASDEKALIKIFEYYNTL